MEFSGIQWEAIGRAWRFQAYNYRALAEKTPRPIIRNQRLDEAELLIAIATQIEEDRRQRAKEVSTIRGG